MTRSRIDGRQIGRSATRLLGWAPPDSAELGIAFVTGSVGLLGDALHNLSDVSTSVMLFAGFRFSKRAGTNAFPYGYDRAEDMAGLAIAVVIWASAVFAGVESFHKLTHHGATRHLGAGMVGAIIGVAANRVVARYKLRAGTQIQSATLIADARHSWLDAISSAGALTGRTRRRRVRRVVERSRRWHRGHRVEGVTGAFTKARWSGRRLRIEAVVTLDSDTPLGDATHTCHHVELSILRTVPEARTVHVTPICD